MTLSIEQLPEIVAGLSAHERTIFNRIFDLECGKGALLLPSQMLPWVEAQFGSVEQVKRQSIIKLTNLFTGESSIYNPLRSHRPRDCKRVPSHRKLSAAQQGDDLFADPLNNTSEDVFGRVRGKHCITAGNIAKYAPHHGVIIFNNSSPMDFGCSEVADYLETGWKWMKKAHDFDREALYGLFLWNCTNRSGASIAHGHAQVVLGRGRHFARVEQLHRAALEYGNKWKADYFTDLFRVHMALGLGWRHGDTCIMAYLGALKQNEIILVSNALDGGLKQAIYGVLSGMRDRLGVKSFNLGLAFPPLENITGWEGFPLVARIVDRGSPGDLSSDIGAMEFYGANVIGSDPFHTAEVLKKGPH